MMKLFGKARREKGSEAETLARRYLEQHGLHTVEQNVHSRFGEIDLIMREETTLLFVEVRYRSSQQFGGAVASIDRKKQQRLIATAQHYLQRNPHQGPCRFDVIAISDAPITIEWLKNAFELSE